MRHNKSQPAKKPSFALVVDGETEYWYFQMMIRHEKDRLNVHIKPELPSKKTLSGQFKMVKDLAADYDKVFWIVDLDVILKDTAEAKNGSKTRLAEFGGYLATIVKKHLNIVVVVNNPCLEFWLLLHFEATSKSFDNCSGAERQLQKHLPGYEKTKKYFTNQNNDIYLRLRPERAAALSNGGKLGRFDVFRPCNPISEMHLLFDTLGLGLGQHQESK